MKSISWLWEIPLALLSLIFFKITKFAIGNLFIVYLAIAKSKASQWRILSQETIDTPLSLPVLMTKGPRWNTHAVIGTLGPFKVENNLALELKSANISSKSWIVVIYSFPGYRTVASLESNSVSNHSNWQTIELQPGKYSLGVRYYNYTEKISYPAVKVDGRQITETYHISSNVNNFYYNLIGYKNWFYTSLHYYIYIILKYRKWLPETWIEREYLPVGAPDTYFHYNYLVKHQALAIDIEPTITNSFDVYFTLYDRSSLPISWCTITENKYRLPPQSSNGYYLLRIRPKPQSETLDKVTRASDKANLPDLNYFNFQSLEEDSSIQHWSIGKQD